MGNAYVAPPVDVPKDPWAGVWIAEDIRLIRQGVERGDWIDGSIGVAGASLDALALVSDPLGVLSQYGVAWMIEHVEPLCETLDQLAGDPGHIRAHAQTWRNVSAGLSRQAEEIDRAVRFDVSEWNGAAGDAYRERSGQQHAAIGALAVAAETMAVVTEVAGLLVAAVRELVRDAIATLVSRLVVYAAEEAVTFGAATPLVVEQVGTLVASWTAKIARWVRSLLRSLDDLAAAVRRIERHIEDLKDLLARIRKAEDEAGALQRVKKKGAGAVQLYRMSTVRSIAEKYGIDLAGLRISLADTKFRGNCGETRPDGSIVLYVSGFRSEEDLARTLVHEKFHHDELASGKPYPRDRAEFDAFEDRAYAYEDLWWDNQPIRPEPRKR
ncbi:hypothetical protein Aca07nite_80230 [Actinoplanes capillaceus]|uniref:Uncharacterized protein n=1 Tax=Actinoplanes campanulatus TaxID=113559 RepID=A0ABQ3WX85_9ACTN|nr:hypothetical protein [Actinoplanes capillaceus]GID50748.1 hypothetical protein Aca07nite_80230 [Actinoplanes capillaceus]